MPLASLFDTLFPASPSKNSPTVETAASLPALALSAGSIRMSADIPVALRPLQPQELRSSGLEGGLLIERVSGPAQLAGVQPGDVLLVEGNSRISGIIKYLTQSTWSHAALYVGPIDGAVEPDGEPHVLVEAYVGDGVISAPLSKYFDYHTRLCRPVGLTFEDRHTVCRYAINRIGFGYDTKNIVDLMRFLFPLPVPQRWRRW